MLKNLSETNPVSQGKLAAIALMENTEPLTLKINISLESLLADTVQKINWLMKRLLSIFKRNLKKDGLLNKLPVEPRLKVLINHVLRLSTEVLKRENLKVQKKSCFQGKKKTKGTKETRGTIPDKKNISERPREADERSEIGHFESDTVIGAARKGAIMTYVDRESGYGFDELMTDKKASTFNRATIEVFKVIPSKFIKTFTSDNGKKFAGFKELEKELNVECYFANPYHSWERGYNENYNELLRRYFLMGSNFFKLTKEEVRKVMKALNHRPRKRLGWKIPHEVFWGEIQECCI